MFILIAEFIIFASIIGFSTYTFKELKENTRSNDINYKELITELNGISYENIDINSRIDKDKQKIYKQIVLEFNEGELNENLCNFLNNNN